MKNSFYHKDWVVLFLLALLVMPIILLTGHAQTWTVQEKKSPLPITDAGNDVFRYTDFDPCRGEQGAFHPEIDILRVMINGTDLVLEFNATPIINSSYYTQIYVFIDSDNVPEYRISRYGVPLILRRLNDSQIWHPTGEYWDTDLEALTVTISGQNMTIHDVIQPLPTLATANIQIFRAYEGPEYRFIDYALYDPVCVSIPSFSLLLVLFSIVPLLGILLHLRKEKHPLSLS
jgi:hypothetical protein